MKVVIAAVSAPTEMNGVSRHAANLVAALLLQTKSIGDVHFIAGAWQERMFRQVCENPDPRLHVHFVSLGDANFNRLGWYYRELPQIARQLEADVVHFGCPAPVRVGAFRCATVVSLHDLYPFEIGNNFGRFRSILTRRIMAGCIRSVDALACVTDSTRRSLAKWFPEQAQKAVTIPNVVEPSRFQRIESYSVIPEGRLFFLCVAQHRKNKNIPVAVRLLASLIERRLIPCNSQLVVVGIPGPETQRIRELIRHLRLEENVLLVHGLSDGELQWCYRHCRALLAPSLIEGFGLPVAEALIAGCPVVCSDIPAFREVGGEQCRYVAAGDGELERYAEAVRQVVSEPRPGQVSMPNLSWQAVGQKYVALYTRLACCGTSDFWYATATRTAERQGRAHSTAGEM
jgi:glycosyltransferase involved in cell wall biosynthesis